VFFVVAAIAMGVFAELYRKARLRALDEKQELALRESERRYRTLVEMSPEAVTVLQERVIVYATRRRFVSIGLSRLRNLYPGNHGTGSPDDREKVLERFNWRSWARAHRCAKHASCEWTAKK